VIGEVATSAQITPQAQLGGATYLARAWEPRTTQLTIDRAAKEKATPAAAAVALLSVRVFVGLIALGREPLFINNFSGGECVYRTPVRRSSFPILTH
jgi:hypothetical protein